MRIIIYILSVVVLISCSSKKEKVIDLSTIIPQAERNSEGDTLTKTVENIDDSLLNYFADNGVFTTEVVKIENKLFPDRFRPESAERYQLKINEDSIRYYKWRFSDSSRVMNAFYNWIDCFGDNCKSIVIGEKKRFQTNAMLIYVCDSTLIYIDGANLDDVNWNSFHDSLGYNNEWNYLIEQSTKGRAEWFTFIDKKKKKLDERL